MSFSSPCHSQPLSLLVQYTRELLISLSTALLGNVAKSLLQQTGQALVAIKWKPFLRCPDKFYRINVHSIHSGEDLYQETDILYKRNDPVAYQQKCNRNHQYRWVWLSPSLQSNTQLLIFMVSAYN